MTKRDKQRIEAAILRLKALTNLRNRACDVPAEAKEAVRLYVNTWVIPTLERILTPQHTGRWEATNLERDLAALRKAHDDATRAN